MFPHKCTTDNDCDEGTCCSSKSSTYCVSKCIVDSDKAADESCILFEGNYTGHKLSLRNGEIRKHLNYSKEFGFRSIKLSNPGCKLKLCYQTGPHSKSCNNFVGGDYYKEHKPLPNYASCICDPHLEKHIIHSDRKLADDEEIKIAPFNKATIILKFYPPLKHEFSIRLGEIVVKISKKSAKITSNTHKFKSVYLARKKRYLPISTFWISFKPGVIKIGHDSLLEKNLFVVFESTDEKTISLMDKVDTVSFVGLKKIKDSFVEFRFFNSGPSPFVSSIHDPLMNLPKQIQIMYPTIESFEFGDDDLRAIEYSLNTPDCFLNKISGQNEFKQKLSALIFTKRWPHYLIVELWHSNRAGKNAHQIQQRIDNAGLVKALAGNYSIEWYNHNNLTSKVNSAILSTNQSTWYTSDYFNIYRIGKFNASAANRPSILLKTSINLRPVEFIYADLISKVKEEYTKKTCYVEKNVNGHEGNSYCKFSCSFKEKICATVLNNVKYKCVQSGKLTNDNIYECDQNAGMVKSTGEKCYNANLFDQKAQVKLTASLNSSVSGVLLFEQISLDFIRIKGNISGLNANSEHAMHIHEYGDLNNECRDTGPHFNPLLSDRHGDLKGIKENRHAGDLGNIQTDEQGKAQVDIVHASFNILGDNHMNVLNRSVVLHAGKDDLGKGNVPASRSNGNSGPRIACGRIELL